MAFPYPRRLLSLALVCLALATAFLASAQPTAAQTSLTPLDRKSVV